MIHSRTIPPRLEQLLEHYFKDSNDAAVIEELELKKQRVQQEHHLIQQQWEKLSERSLSKSQQSAQQISQLLKHFRQRKETSIIQYRDFLSSLGEHSDRFDKEKYFSQLKWSKAHRLKETVLENLLTALEKEKNKTLDDYHNIEMELGNPVPSNDNKSSVDRKEMIENLTLLKEEKTHLEEQDNPTSNIESKHSLEVKNDQSTKSQISGGDTSLSLLLPDKKDQTNDDDSDSFFD